jgi:predicted N-formylglutamate amidohydrolase
VLIEVRQDLISTGEGERLWAARLAPILSEAIEELPHG